VKLSKEADLMSTMDSFIFETKDVLHFTLTHDGGSRARCYSQHYEFMEQDRSFIETHCAEIIRCFGSATVTAVTKSSSAGWSLAIMWI
jgi:hypothetical protein